jgi:NAD(P)-dependent dehydrogenase (short-subunit alcohol dehydrogenase family)
MDDQAQVVFISAGGSGIGLSLAKHFSARGGRVAVFDLSVSDAVRSELALRTSSSALSFHEVDVRDADALASAAAEAAAVLGSPTLAVNSAGIQISAPFTELSQEQFSRVLDINLLGSRNFAAAVLPHMQAGSRLALVGSLAGFSANYCYAAYSASKFGVIGLGRVLRLECKPRGIAVTLICPPEVDTPMVEEEKKTMHPVSRRLKDLGGSLSIDEAVAGILAGLDAGRDVIIPGARAKMTYFCSRYLPDALMNLVVDRIVASELANMAREGGAENP